MFDHWVAGLHAPRLPPEALPRPFGLYSDALTEAVESDPNLFVALYDFVARDDDELSFTKGNRRNLDLLHYMTYITVNDLLLYGTFLISVHSKRFTILPNIH